MVRKSTTDGGMGVGPRDMKFIVTGSAGFIGFHMSRLLLAKGHEVLGIDAMTPYYDPALKASRVDILTASPNFSELTGDIADAEMMFSAFERFKPDVVLHFAAQAGVRYSISNPEAYVGSNLIGTFNVLEACRRHPVRHLLIASTSSVYGANERFPFAETDKADLPLTFYAATKKSCEAMAHSYAHLFAIPTTMLRFFTVYGPWGRPDMALFKFTRAIIEGEPIEVFNHGHMTRDFTYIDDLVAAISALVDEPPVIGEPVGPSDTLSPVAPHRVVNIGGGTPVRLGHFIDLIEKAIGMPATRIMLPMQDGDVPNTFASSGLLECLIGRPPSTPVEVGVPRFVDWYRSYHLQQEPVAEPARSLPLPNRGQAPRIVEQRLT